MFNLKLVAFALKSNAVFFALLAVWLFAAGVLVSGQVKLYGSFVWGGTALLLCALALFTVRGLRANKKWAWPAAMLFALLNLWLGVRSVIGFWGYLDSHLFSRQAGAIAFMFYFFVAGLIILLGLLFGKDKKTTEAKQP